MAIESDAMNCTHRGTALLYDRVLGEWAGVARGPVGLRENNSTTASVAGAGRALLMTRCQIRHNDLGAHAQGPAQATVELTGLFGNGQDVQVEDDASLLEQGNHR